MLISRPDPLWQTAGMPKAHSNGIEIEYAVFGEPKARPLLLMRGLGTQMIQWHPSFCEMLADAGHRLVIFDNRDAGLSTHLHDAGVPQLGAVLTDVAAGRRPAVPYTLDDMADDVVGLMDTLEMDSAHLAGISMGGMIAQQTAIRHATRVRSLTSMISSSGEPGLPGPTPEAAAVLMKRAPAERGAYVDHQVETARVIGSPDFAFDEAAYRELAGRVFDRAYDPAGIARQMAAITASGSRREGLERLRVPALVVHGDADPLVPLAAGRATAAAIPGAGLTIIEGMGHDVPEGAWRDIVAAIAVLTRAAEG